MKHGGGLVFVWGYTVCMYKAILWENVYASAIKLGLWDDYYLQQENDPKLLEMLE